jgi:hypothetical protein
MTPSRPIQLLGLLVVTAALLLVGCDPGIYLKPVDCRRVSDFEWSTETRGVEIRIGRLGGLIGETWASPEFRVINNTSEQVVIEAADLTSQGMTYPGTFCGTGEASCRSAGPGLTSRVTINWKWSKPITNIYGRDAVITLHLMIGQTMETVRIKYERSS